MECARRSCWRSKAGGLTSRDECSMVAVGGFALVLLCWAAVVGICVKAIDCEAVNTRSYH